MVQRKRPDTGGLAPHWYPAESVGGPYLFRRYVAVDILRADEGVEEQVAEAGDDHPVAADEAHLIGHQVLDERDDAATADEGHEDARRQRGVFAQPLGGQVVDGAPHDGRAEAAEEHEDHAQRHLSADDGDREAHILGDEDEAEQEDGGKQADGRQHRLARDAATHGAAHEASAHHQEPVEADECPSHHGADPLEVRHVEVGRVRDAYLDADVEEDGYGAQHKVAERHRAVRVFLRVAREARGALVGRLHVRLGDACQQDDEEGQSEDGHRNDHGRGRVVHLSRLHRAADEVAQKDGGDRSADGVARAAELDELIATVAAAAQGVQHGVDGRVKQAHRYAGHEGAEYIDAERDGGIHIARYELDAHAHKAHDGGQ